MPNDRKVKVSFSASAEDYICRFMKIAEETMPNASLVPVIEWYILKKFTSKDLYEIDASYTCGDNIVFIGSGSERVWNLAVPQRSWRKVSLAVSIVGFDIMTGDEQTAYAISDNRRLIRQYPELPLFELAVFDLVSKTSSKHDFAPVEAALTDAGFVVSELKFQPNSTGKIIVSDSTKAALLEFSGLP